MANYADGNKLNTAQQADRHKSGEVSWNVEWLDDPRDNNVESENKRE